MEEYDRRPIVRDPCRPGDNSRGVITHDTEILVLETQNVSKGQRAGMTFAICKQIVQGFARFSAILRANEGV